MYVQNIGVKVVVQCQNWEWFSHVLTMGDEIDRKKRNDMHWMSIKFYKKNCAAGVHSTTQTECWYYDFAIVNCTETQNPKDH